MNRDTGNLLLGMILGGALCMAGAGAARLWNEGEEHARLCEELYDNARTATDTLNVMLDDESCMRVFRPQPGEET